MAQQSLYKKQNSKWSNLSSIVFFWLAMLAVVFYAWNEQSTARGMRAGPLYRNLMDFPSYIKRGFNSEDTKKITDFSEEWVFCDIMPPKVVTSNLPDLPKRKFLSPWGMPAEEFTIIMLLEMDNAAMEILNGNLSVIPGISLAHIGENWEIFFNGKLVRSEMHLDEAGRMKSRRPQHLWRASLSNPSRKTPSRHRMKARSRTPRQSPHTPRRSARRGSGCSRVSLRYPPRAAQCR